MSVWACSGAVQMLGSCRLKVAVYFPSINVSFTLKFRTLNAIFFPDEARTPKSHIFWRTLKDGEATVDKVLEFYRICQCAEKFGNEPSRRFTFKCLVSRSFVYTNALFVLPGKWCGSWEVQEGHVSVGNFFLSTQTALSLWGSSNLEIQAKQQYQSVVEEKLISV